MPRVAACQTFGERRNSSKDEPKGMGMASDRKAEMERVLKAQRDGFTAARPEPLAQLLHEVGAGAEKLRGLLGRGPRDGRQDPEGVAGQHHDVARMPGEAGR